MPKDGKETYKREFERACWLLVLPQTYSGPQGSEVGQASFISGLNRINCKLAKKYAFSKSMSDQLTLIKIYVNY